MKCGVVQDMWLPAEMAGVSMALVLRTRKKQSWQPASIRLTLGSGAPLALGAPTSIHPPAL